METKLEAMLAAEEIPVSSDFIDTLVEQRVGPGILLLSPELKLMHMNRQAWELSRKITQGENGKAATGVLPPAVTELCAEVSAALRSKSTSSTSWRKPAAPLARASSRGFSLPDRPLWPQRRSVPPLRRPPPGARLQGWLKSAGHVRFQLRTPRVGTSSESSSCSTAMPIPKDGSLSPPSEVSHSLVRPHAAVLPQQRH